VSNGTGEYRITNIPLSKECVAFHARSPGKAAMPNKVFLHRLRDIGLLSFRFTCIRWLASLSRYSPHIVIYFFLVNLSFLERQSIRSLPLVEISLARIHGTGSYYAQLHPWLSPPTNNSKELPQKYNQLTELTSPPPPQRPSQPLSPHNEHTH